MNLAFLVGLAAVAISAVGLVLQQRRRATLLERRLARATEDLEALQHSFERFAPAVVVDQIVEQGVSIRPEMKDVTILFADLRGFTAIAEKLEPTVLVTVLNGYFACMERALAENRGHLAKFIGDGLLALFGALEANPWQTNDALHAALAMRAALVDYNRRLVDQGLPALACGIGVHRGPVVAGVLGAAAVKEYGVIGRTVNVAARIERLTRVHDTDILVSETVRAHGDPSFHLLPMPATSVKGIPDPIVTLALDGFA